MTRDDDNVLWLIAVWTDSWQPVELRACASQNECSRQNVCQSKWMFSSEHVPVQMNVLVRTCASPNECSLTLPTVWKVQLLKILERFYTPVLWKLHLCKSIPEDDELLMQTKEGQIIRFQRTGNCLGFIYGRSWYKNDKRIHFRYKHQQIKKRRKKKEI